MIDDVARGPKGFVRYVFGVVGVCFRHEYGQVMGYAMYLVRAVSGTHKPDPTMHRSKYLVPSCTTDLRDLFSRIRCLISRFRRSGGRTAWHEGVRTVSMSRMHYSHRRRTRLFLVKHV